jgi:hypothetical protein
LQQVFIVASPSSDFDGGAMGFLKVAIEFSSLKIKFILIL